MYENFEYQINICRFVIIRKFVVIMKKGKFIVLYGTNNLGKTTQAKLLVEKLNNEGHKSEYIKYPIYDSEPTGKLINQYLREGNPYNLSPTSFQLIHYIDKANFELQLKKKLENGIIVVAEDYFGTTLAWGISAGVNREFLEYLYPFLYKEDLMILFDGERFNDSIENNHKHENDDELMQKVREVHLELGKKYNWKKVNANLGIEEISEIIWSEVEGILK